MGELLNYGGEDVYIWCLQKLFYYSVIWHEEVVPRQWREKLIFKKGDREQPGNYRGITVLSIVGKVVCNNRMVQRLEYCMKDRLGLTSCIVILIVQSRLREGKQTYAFFLDVQMILYI